MKYEVVTSEAPLGEGPVWCPDGTLVITTISPGGLLRIDPASGRTERIASFPGGGNPNLFVTFADRCRCG